VFGAFQQLASYMLLLIVSTVLLLKGVRGVGKATTGKESQRSVARSSSRDDAAGSN